MSARRVSAVAAALVGSAVVLFPSVASAHTDLVRTDPRDGSQLDVTPTSVTLVFSEAVSPELSTVLLSVGEGGARRDLTVRQGETPSALTMAVPQDALPEGGANTKWVTTYRVTSQDGHAVEGTLAFRAPAADEPSQGADPSAPSATSDAEPPSPSAGSSDSAQVAPEAVDRSSESTSTSTSTVVIGGIALAGAALGCGLLVRARRRSLDS